MRVSDDAVDLAEAGVRASAAARSSAATLRLWPATMSVRCPSRHWAQVTRTASRKNMGRLRLGDEWLYLITDAQAGALVAEDDPETSRRLGERILTEAFRVNRTIEDLLTEKRREDDLRAAGHGFHRVLATDLFEDPEAEMSRLTFARSRLALPA